MSAKTWLVSLMVPAALAASLGACNQSSGTMQPGYVNTSSAGSYNGSTSGEQGRVMSIREVSLSGGSGSGMSGGTLAGGGIGFRFPAVGQEAGDFSAQTGAQAD